MRADLTVCNGCNWLTAMEIDNNCKHKWKKNRRTTQKPPDLNVSELRAVWKTTNSSGDQQTYKCQIGFSNVLCKQLFLLDRVLQHNKPYYLPRSIYSWRNNLSLYCCVPRSCWNPMQQLIFMLYILYIFMIWRVESKESSLVIWLRR